MACAAPRSPGRPRRPAGPATRQEPRPRLRVCDEFARDLPLSPSSLSNRPSLLLCRLLPPQAIELGPSASTLRRPVETVPSFSTVLSSESHPSPLSESYLQTGRTRKSQKFQRHHRVGFAAASARLARPDLLRRGRPVGAVQWTGRCARVWRWKGLQVTTGTPGQDPLAGRWAQKNGVPPALSPPWKGGGHH